ncbi:MAG: hypothetical protein IID59_07885 [Proteobacteria bacterium]|nr:hypothetical protein [Pseudomonadota bacterium]
MIVFSMAVAQAETVLTVNGTDIDSRTQKPASQVTQEERDSLITEISDVYLPTSQPGVEDLNEQLAGESTTGDLETRQQTIANAK